MLYLAILLDALLNFYRIIDGYENSTISAKYSTPLEHI